MAKYRIYWWAIVGIPTQRIRGHDDVDTNDPIMLDASGRSLWIDENMVEEIKRTGELTEYDAEKLLDLAANGAIFLGSFSDRYCNADMCYDYGLVKVVRLGDKRARSERKT